MADRKPRILSIHPHSENGVQSIRAFVVYDGLKGQPVDVIEISPKHAADLAAGLTRALRTFVPEGNATEWVPRSTDTGDDQ